jgi:hypothetical protein
MATISCAFGSVSDGFLQPLAGYRTVSHADDWPSLTAWWVSPGTATVPGVPFLEYRELKGLFQVPSKNDLRMQKRDWRYRPKQ